MLKFIILIVGLILLFIKPFWVLMGAVVYFTWKWLDKGASSRGEETKREPDLQELRKRFREEIEKAQRESDQNLANQGR